MIGITEEGKQAFLDRDNIELVMHFEDGTILSNDDFVSNTFQLEQTLCEEEQLVYGSVGSACFSIQVLRTLKNFKGLRFTATLFASEREYEVPLGTFTVTDDTLSDSRRFRTLKAYDDISIHANDDVSQWYQSLRFPMTLIDFRYSLFNHVGIIQESTKLVNDGMIVTRTVDVSETVLTFQTVLKAICEINGALGCITQYNNFRYVTPDIDNDALYPAEDLYPADDLYPRDYFNIGLFPNNNLFPSEEIYPSDPTSPVVLTVSGENSIIRQSSYVYKDYRVLPIDKVVIKENNEDYGTIYGTGTNTYEIVGNFLTYANDDMETLASQFFKIVNAVTYVPSKVTVLGLPWVELGDYIKIIGTTDGSILPLLHRTLTGVTALVDNFESKGTEYAKTQLNGVNASIQQTKSRTLKLVQSVKEVSSELTEEIERATGEEEVLSSKIEQTVEQISLKVSKGEVSSELSVESGQVSIRGNRLVVDATNFSLTADGTLTARNGKFTGTVTGSSISGSSFTSQSAYNSVYIGNGKINMTASSGQTGISLSDGYIDVGNSMSRTTRISPNQILLYGSSTSTTIDSGWYQMFNSGSTVFRVNSVGEIDCKNIYCRDTKSRVVSTKDYNDRLLYCYETPTPLFGDVGEGKTDEYGTCYIYIDDILSETLENCQYQVFLQKYGEGDVYVSEREEDHFVVKGTANLSFGWELKAVQKGYALNRLDSYNPEK